MKPNNLLSDSPVSHISPNQVRLLKMRKEHETALPITKVRTLYGVRAAINPDKRRLAKLD